MLFCNKFDLTSLNWVAGCYHVLLSLNYQTYKLARTEEASGPDRLASSCSPRKLPKVKVSRVSKPRMTTITAPLRSGIKIIPV